MQNQPTHTPDDLYPPNEHMTTVRDAMRIVSGWTARYSPVPADDVIEAVARALVQHCGGFTDRGCDLTSELRESFGMDAAIAKATGEGK